MNTYLFRVKLEKYYFIKWTRDIQDLIEKYNNSTNSKENNYKNSGQTKSHNIGDSNKWFLLGKTKVHT